VGEVRGVKKQGCKLGDGGAKSGEVTETNSPHRSGAPLPPLA
jgi:hypothetical protein